MNNSQDPAQLFGYDVTDASGNKIGKVDNVWVDDATNELEFVGVKTGWLMGKTHVIPVANAQISNGSIQVPFDEDQIKNAPSFSGDDEAVSRARGRDLQLLRRGSLDRGEPVWSACIGRNRIQL